VFFYRSRLPLSVIQTALYSHCHVGSRLHGKKHWHANPSKACLGHAECRRPMLGFVHRGTLSTRTLVIINRPSFAGFGQVRPCHSKPDGETAKKCIPRRDRPTIAFGSPAVDELRTGYLFLVLSTFSTLQRNTLCTRPRRRGLRTALAPLPSSSALEHR
jgi:hypothetical protein